MTEFGRVVALLVPGDRVPLQKVEEVLKDAGAWVYADLFQLKDLADPEWRRMAAITIMEAMARAATEFDESKT